MKCALLAAAVLSLSPAVLAQSTSFQLVKEYSGTDFFQGWSFYGNFDNLTNGDVTYVNQTNATNLAYVNSAGNAIIKVDNTSFVPYNEKRNSVRVTSDDYFDMGTVWVFDATHLPFGCSVWPSFWTKGPLWPDGGEIDIIEAVNLMPNNQMALHTESTCNAANTTSQLGTLNLANCSTSAGCTVLETQPNSFGSAFASAGGGVYAALFDTSGISIWFWTRANVPSSVSSATNSLDISSWGTPSANYSAASCDIAQAFSAQQLVLDITLCGDWAGVPSVYDSTCPVPGGANASSCYITNVINNGTPAYADAYFEIAYIKAFNANGSIQTPASASGSAGGAQPTGAGKPSGALARRVPGAVAALVALGAWTLL
ncbi:concanavalin A-like lectin/glucanase domain-containing protein [Amylocystis lapponica]|nr:concanavalin A-like lectin/glucanase domain-containing protein [Amylocystis lapponica]